MTFTIRPDPLRSLGGGGLPLGSNCNSNLNKMVLFIEYVEYFISEFIKRNINFKFINLYYT